MGNQRTGLKLQKTDLDHKALAKSVDKACRLLKVLANSDRLLILCRLATEELCVKELESSLNILQPTLSQQLTVLREEGLVTTRRQGKHIYYGLTSQESIALIATLQEQFCQSDCKR